VLSLALSLIFGAGQLIFGSLVARQMLRGGRWRIAGRYLLLLVSLWFVCSGVAELLVSGMEMARRLTAHPSASAFTTWRSRIDAALLVASVALFVALCLYPLVRRLAARPGAARDEAAPADSRGAP
jgi:hypothetical protein